MASGSRILLPFALWPENPPSLSVSSLFINFASDDLITGTNDGFIVCWKILSDHQKIIPRLMLIGHTNQVAFIVASLSTHQIEQFVSISDNDGEIKLWSNEDGHCVEHIRTNLKHRSVQCFNYQLTNENFLICCGCYSEILIYDMRTLEIKYTLTPSNVNADWISAFFVFQKANAPDVIIAIGLLDSGCVKLWAFDPRTATSNTAIEGTSIGNNNSLVPVDLKEHESKEIRTQFGSMIVPCDECQRMMLIVHGQGWHIFDGIDFTELCSYVIDGNDIVKNEHWINGYFPTQDLVLLFSARGYAHFFRLPENATFTNPKFRSQHNKTDMQLPQWLCRLSVGNELKLPLTPTFSCHTKLKHCQIYRVDASGQISVWQINLKQLATSNGNLDRIEQGIVADELFDWYNDPRILNGSSDLNDPLSTVMVPAHYLQIRSTWKRRDYDQIRKLNKKFGVSRHDLMGISSFKHSEYRLPIIVQQFHTNLGDDLAMLILFDLLQLIKNIETANKDTRASLDETSKSLSTLSNLLVALLHPWSFNKNVDQLCEQRLHLKRINRFFSFGILSKNDHLTIVLPTWQQHLNDNIPETFLPPPPKLISFAETDIEDEETLKQKRERMETYVYQWRWKYSTILNTEHLLSLVTMVYILMNCDRWINNISSDQDEQVLLTQRECWSKLLQFYCSDMIEQCQTTAFESLSIEILCSHWQDLCLELRDAARKLLEKELDHLHNNTDSWYIFISKWSNLFNQSFSKEMDGALFDQDIRDIFVDDIYYNNEVTTTATSKEQYKAQQLLSIVLIGIIGARYGQEIEPTKQSSAPIKGFTVDSPEMILKLSRILTSLLSPSNFDHIPVHSALRRTATELIGRGYTIWEPYLDIGQVLLTLLDLCAISDSSTVTSK
ncbi:unnamed protein product [Rotaria socialis]|uniref:Uncharacterized protein n=1 Tax=Rotaria socialis TaxID=392032 RepID=A0A820QXI1_9BILA|nr:unnamed protein product [Rotaria socialis]